MRLDDNKIRIFGARRADVTGLGVPEHHRDSSALPMLVQRSNLSFKIWSSGGVGIIGWIARPCVPGLLAPCREGKKEGLVA